MLGQRLELLVRLGKRPRFLASLGGHLTGWLNTETHEQLCKLVVGHECVLVSLRCLQQCRLLGFDAFQMRRQHVLVQHEGWLDEHPQGAVDHLELLGREPFTHAGKHEAMEQGARQLHVVAAVLAVSGKLFW